MFKRIRSRTAFWRWYLLEFRPMAGADGSTDPDPKPDPAPDPKPDPAPDPKPDPAPDTETMPKDEAQRLRRIAAEADAAERKRKQKEQEDAGNHQAVVSGVEAERDAEKTAREAAEAKADERVAELERNTTATTVASRLKFNDPADALLHLPADTPNDEASIEKALKKVAEEKAYLVGGQGSRTGAPGGGGEPAPPTDIDAAIAKAEADGDVALSTRLKRQKHFSSSQ